MFASRPRMQGLFDDLPAPASGKQKQRRDDDNLDAKLALLRRDGPAAEEEEEDGESEESEEENDGDAQPHQDLRRRSRPDDDEAEDEEEEEPDERQVEPVAKRVRIHEDVVTATIEPRADAPSQVRSGPCEAMQCHAMQPKRMGAWHSPFPSCRSGCRRGPGRGCAAPHRVAHWERGQVRKSLPPVAEAPGRALADSCVAPGAHQLALTGEMQSSFETTATHHQTDLFDTVRAAFNDPGVCAEPLLRREYMKLIAAIASRPDLFGKPEKAHLDIYRLIGHVQVSARGLRREICNDSLVFHTAYVIPPLIPPLLLSE